MVPPEVKSCITWGVIDVSQIGDLMLSLSMIKLSLLTFKTVKKLAVLENLWKIIEARDSYDFIRLTYKMDLKYRNLQKKSWAKKKKHLF